MRYNTDSIPTNTSTDLHLEIKGKGAGGGAQVTRLPPQDPPLLMFSKKPHDIDCSRVMSQLQLSLDTNHATVVVISFYQLLSWFLTFLYVTVWHFRHRFFVFVCCGFVLELFLSLLIQDLKHLSMNMKFDLDVNQSREANSKQKYRWQHRRAWYWTSLWYLHDSTMYPSQRLYKLSSWNIKLFDIENATSTFVIGSRRSKPDRNTMRGVCALCLAFLRTFFRSQLVLDKFQNFRSSSFSVV